MKLLKRSILFLMSLFTLVVNAQQTTDTSSVVKVDSVKYWKIITVTGFNFNQISLSNWATGGESSLSGKATINFDANYKKDKINFENNISLAYGIIGTEGSKIQKTDDKIDISSSLGLNAFGKWFYSTVINFKSQFDRGYKYPNDSTVISRFFAPAYLTVSLGLDYKPNDYLSFFFSPAAGKLIFVMDQDLADKGAFGVTPAVIDDSTGIVLVKGKNLKPEFGFNIIAKIEKEILKNVIVKSKLNLYNNYLDEDISNKWNIDVDWETSIHFKINKSLSTVLYIHLIYDHNVLIPEYEEIDGKKVKVAEGPKLQFKESFGIGLFFKF